jgi:hypothetical protein
MAMVTAVERVEQGHRRRVDGPADEWRVVVIEQVSTQAVRFGVQLSTMPPQK